MTKAQIKASDQATRAMETLVRTAVMAERDRCVKIAMEYECSLSSFHSPDAEKFYEIGVIDAAVGIAEAICGNFP